MYFINQRYGQANNSTQGIFFQREETNAWKFFSHVVEDDSSGPVAGDVRLPSGLYKLRIHPNETPKTKIFRATSMKYLERMIEVMDYYTPPRFGLVFFHVGNDQNDTEKCVLLNDAIGNNNFVKLKVASQSTPATERFYSIVYPFLKGGGEVLYEIRDEESLWKP